VTWEGLQMLQLRHEGERISSIGFAEWSRKSSDMPVHLVKIAEKAITSRLLGNQHCLACNKDLYWHLS
jgi:hypothetical protein